MAISTINQAGLNAPLTLTAPNLGTPSAINLANATGLPASALPTGSVLQVASVTKTDTFSTSSATWVDVTGLSLSITPSKASSKILVLYNVIYSAGQVNNTTNAIKLVRNSTTINVGSDASYVQALGGFNEATAELDLSFLTVQLSGSYLDSPATTSSTTYKMQAQNQYNSNTVYINRDGYGLGTGRGWRTASTITVMEIAA
jgi:hypothetical protein